jgi:hypothetical protein
MKKKILSLSLTAIMVLNMLTLIIPFTAFANATFEYTDYTVEYTISNTNTRNNTQGIIVTITNTGTETIENWMLTYDDFCGEITGIWNASVETEDGTDYIRNVGYNANISPNSSVNFGYTLANYTGEPQSIEMCQVRVEKTSGYIAVLNVTNDWGSGFNGEIVLTNLTDKPIEWWELTFDSNFTITQITTSWAASVIDNGNGNYTFKGTYTGIVQPNSFVTLGFQGTKSLTPMTDNILLTEVVFFLQNGTDEVSDYAEMYDKITAEAFYDPAEHEVTISWEATKLYGEFEIFMSTDGDEYNSLGTTLDTEYVYVPENASDFDFIVLYFYVVQTIEEDVITSNIYHAFYSEIGTPWEDCLRTWNISADDELLARINTNQNSDQFSVQLVVAGVPNLHLIVRKSAYSNAIPTDSVVGIAPELLYKDGLKVDEITVNFEMDALLENNEKYRIFKYFDFAGEQKIPVNMSLPIETQTNDNALSATIPTFGTYFVVDIETWLESLGYVASGEIAVSSRSASKIQSIITSYEDEGSRVFYDNNFIFNDSTSIEIDDNMDENYVPIDVSFVLQAGRGDTDSEILSDQLVAFEEQKNTIIELSEKLFTKFPNAKIRIMTYKNGVSDFIATGTDKNCFDLDSFASIDGVMLQIQTELTAVTYDTSNTEINRSPAFSKLRKEIKAYTLDDCRLLAQYLANFPIQFTEDEIELYNVFTEDEDNSTGAVLNLADLIALMQFASNRGPQVSSPTSTDENFVYHFINGATIASCYEISDYDGTQKVSMCQQSLAQNEYFNYSEISISGLGYADETVENSYIETLKNEVKKVGLMSANSPDKFHIFDEQVTDELIYQHILALNADKSFILPTTWEAIALKSKIVPNGLTDSDNDGLTDWEELHDFAKQKLGKTSYFDCVNYVLEMGVEYIDTRLFTDVLGLLESDVTGETLRDYLLGTTEDVQNRDALIGNIPILLVVSDPTKVSTSDDGILDLDKVRVLPVHDSACDKGAYERLISECDVLGCKPGILERYTLEKYGADEDYYDINNTDELDFYVDYRHYLNKLGERYLKVSNQSLQCNTMLLPFMSYTVEALFPEIANRLEYKMTNYPTHIAVAENSVVINTKIYFSGDKLLTSSESFSTLLPDTTGNEYHDALVDKLMSDIVADKQLTIPSFTSSDVMISDVFITGVKMNWERNLSTSWVAWPEDYEFLRGNETSRACSH